MHHGQVDQLDRLLSGVRVGIGIFKSVEVLQQSNNSIASFGKGILF